MKHVGIKVTLFKQ